MAQFSESRRQSVGLKIDFSILSPKREYPRFRWTGHKRIIISFNLHNLLQQINLNTQSVSVRKVETISVIRASLLHPRMFVRAEAQSSWFIKLSSLREGPRLRPSSLPVGRVRVSSDERAVLVELARIDVAVVVQTAVFVAVELHGTAEGASTALQRLGLPVESVEFISKYLN